MHEHLSREFFRALASGWRDPRDLVAITLAHLFELCPRCRREYESWRREVREDEAVPKHVDYDAVMEGIRARIEPPTGDAEAPIDADLRQAQARAEELLGLAPEEQAEWIRTESYLYAGQLLAEVLIEESRRKAPGYPHESYTLAYLACLVLRHAPNSLRLGQTYARAMAYMANAVRVIGDLSRADQILGDAQFFLRSQGGGDRLVRAELDSLEASLRRDQDRPRRAVTVALRALMTYRLEHLENESVATLLQLSRAHTDLLEFGRAQEILTEADQILTAESNPHLHLVAVTNRAYWLYETGSPGEGLELLAELGGVAMTCGGPIAPLRLCWGQGALRGVLGDLEAMESALTAVVDGFSVLGLANDAAQAKVELAGLLIKQHRFREAEEVAQETASVLEEIGLTRRAAQARLLMQQAASR